MNPLALARLFYISTLVSGWAVHFAINRPYERKVDLFTVLFIGLSCDQENSITSTVRKFGGEETVSIL